MERWAVLVESSSCSARLIELGYLPVIKPAKLLQKKLVSYAIHSYLGTLVYGLTIVHRFL